MTRILPALCFSAGWLLGCDGETTVDIEHTRTQPPGATAFGEPDAVRFELEDSSPLSWDVPAGWRQIPGTQFRLANFVLPGDVSCWVSTSGGGTVANINRWLGEMGAPPMDAAQVEALPKVDVLGLPSPMINVEGTYRGSGGGSGDKTDYRMIGAAAQLPATGLFVKMVGPTAAVASQLEAFRQLCRSLRMAGMAPAERPGTAPASDPHGPGAAPAGAAASNGDPKGEDPQTGVSWTRPEGWTDGARNPMRIATFHLPSSPESLCTVTKFGGSPLDNINRWRGEMQARPLSAAELERLEKLRVVGRDAYLLEIEGDYSGGVRGQPIENAKMLAVVCPLDDGFSIFVKLVGPASAIRGERDRFIRLCESLGG